LSELARLERIQGRLAEASEHGARALALARALGDRHAEASALETLGTVRSNQGRTEEAAEALTTGLALARGLGDRRLVGTLASSLAMAEQQRGRLAEARALYEEALATHREIGFRGAEGVALSNLAALSWEQGDRGEAARLMERTLEIHREVGNRRVEGDTLTNLGSIYTRLGRVEEARAAFARALEIHRELGNRRGLGRSLGYLAELERLAAGDLDAADALAAEAERLFTAAGYRVGLGKILCIRSAIALARGGEAARSEVPARLQRAAEIAAEASAGPGSDLGRALAALQRARAASEAGEPDRLYRGELIADLPAELRRALVERGLLPAGRAGLP
jgi:tetratricopeptide (TPR) repeat protein